MNNFEIDRRARKHFESLLPSAWTASPPVDDFGIDYWVQITNKSRSTGLSFYVQLKGSTRLEPEGDHITIRISAKNAASYLRENKPILLIVCGVCSGPENEDVGYYCWIQDYLRFVALFDVQNDSMQGTITIKIPKSNVLTKDVFLRHIFEFVSHVTEYFSDNTKNLVYDFPGGQTGSLKLGPDSFELLEEDGSPIVETANRLIKSAWKCSDNRQWDDAIKLLLQSQGLHPSMVASVELARCYHVLGRMELALQAYDDALIYWPSSASVLCMKGNILFQLGRVIDAWTVHQAAAQIHPNNATIQANLGATLEFMATGVPNEDRQGVLEISFSAYHRALEIEPYNDSYLADAALVLFKLFRFSDSLRLLERAVLANDKNIVAWRRLARTYTMVQRTEDAKNAEKRVAELGGTNDDDILRSIINLAKN